MLFRSFTALCGDSAETLALGPHCIDESAEERFHLVRVRISGEVKVECSDVATEQQITHGSADDVETTSRARELCGDWREFGNHRIETRRLHELQATQRLRH